MLGQCGHHTGMKRRGWVGRWQLGLLLAVCGSAAAAVPGCGRSASKPRQSGTMGAAAEAGQAGAGAGTAGNGGAGTAGSAGSGGGEGGAPSDAGAAGALVEPAKNYEVTGTWPEQPVALATKPGTLKFTKLVLQQEFLAESCSIGDYDNDGVPDVSSGRIWYQGPDFTTAHPFRDGHGPLPRSGQRAESDTGVSDDVADYPVDVDVDGDTDIINCAQSDTDEVTFTANKIGTVQPQATCYWYENPGPTGQAGDPNWTPHLMHDDVRLEQHGLLDMNGDGFPEIYGACRDCPLESAKGYYQADRSTPTAIWRFHAVATPVVFPFGGRGNLHGAGGGDLNGDGLPDLLERNGAWLQQADGSFNATPCTGKNTPQGCGFVEHAFYDGLVDGSGIKGGSHMYAVDMDLDGLADVVSADWAHGEGLAWYKQGADGAFTKYYFLGNSAEVVKYGAYFSEPHALQVVDMDGDGRPDVISGKMRFANTLAGNDPDPNGTPYVYVFRNVADADPKTGAPIRLTPTLVDPLVSPAANALGTPEGGMGVGRQIAIGHANTDGVLDICVATKVGLAVFLGQ